MLRKQRPIRSLTMENMADAILVPSSCTVESGATSPQTKQIAMLYSGNPLVNNSSSWYELYRVDADFDITYAVIELTKTYFYFDHYTPSSDSISSLVGNSVTLVHADEYNAYITAYGSPYLYWRFALMEMPLFVK